MRDMGRMEWYVVGSAGAIALFFGAVIVVSLVYQNVPLPDYLRVGPLCGFAFLALGVSAICYAVWHSENRVTASVIILAIFVAGLVSNMAFNYATNPQHYSFSAVGSDGRQVRLGWNVPFNLWWNDIEFAVINFHFSCKVEATGFGGTMGDLPFEIGLEVQPWVTLSGGASGWGQDLLRTPDQPLTILRTETAGSQITWTQSGSTYTGTVTSLFLDSVSESNDGWFWTIPSKETGQPTTGGKLKFAYRITAVLNGVRSNSVWLSAVVSKTSSGTLVIKDVTFG